MNDSHKSSSDLDATTVRHILGQESSAALKAEQRRIARDPQRSSPLCLTEYDQTGADETLVNPMPCPLDDTIRQLCNEFTNMSPEERAELRSSINMEQLNTLSTFARRSAVFALRESSPQRVVDGLYAIAMIESDRTDWRDILQDLSLLYHAATRVGADAQAMFHDAASLASRDVADLIVGFTQRSSEDRDIQQSWGYQEITTSNGIGIIELGFEMSDYKPTIDLGSLAVTLSSLFDAEEYQMTSLHVATTMDSCWLGENVPDRIVQALQNQLGAACVHLQRRDTTQHVDGSQVLMIFVIEAASDNAARSLLKAALGNKQRDHAQLAVANNRLFCLLISTSVESDTQPDESDESLSRFRNGVELVLHWSMPDENTQCPH